VRCFAIARRGGKTTAVRLWTRRQPFVTAVKPPLGSMSADRDVCAPNLLFLHYRTTSLGSARDFKDLAAASRRQKRPDQRWTQDRGPIPTANWSSWCSEAHSSESDRSTRAGRDAARMAPLPRGLGTRHAGRLSRCPKAMPEADRYTLIVSARANRTHARPWSWEIYRDGEPLPARLREDLPPAPTDPKAPAAVLGAFICHFPLLLFATRA
jgi:hypothetical protein